ncbi:MAG: hypothetical protein HQ553_12545 [Chloroflexi bacterium]|nr:hypothetical protein [Chloroflexota bacterium]
MRKETTQVLNKIKGIKQNGAGWKGRCPAHEDKNPSLSITEGEKGVVLKCHAGCDSEAIVAAWGLEMKDLFFGNGQSAQQIQIEKTETKRTTWEIIDSDGTVVAEHIRIDYSDGSKSFIWRRDGKDGLNGLPVVNLPLYGLKWAIEEPDDSDRDWIVTEGEKAADALYDAGYIALGTVTGASSCPSADSLMLLLGRKGRIILWPDNDDTGRQHMTKVAEQLRDMGVECYFIDWPDAPEKGDAADFIENGGDVNSLLHYVINKLRICPVSTDLASERYKSVTKSVTKCGEDGSSVSKDEVLDWVKDSSGWFSYEELDRELGIKAPGDKSHRRVIMKRLKDDGIIESHPRDNKLFRHVNVEVRLIDFKSAGGRKPLAVHYPFGIEQYFNTYPGNIIAIAGAADAGKTGFLLNFARMNMYDFPIIYQSSEMGPEELASRIENFNDIDLKDWNLTVEERSNNFADVIRPDCINIIDYLEIAGDFYAIADHMRQIHDRLDSGIAMVALQKKRGAELGRGGDFGLEKPRLYLSMDHGEVTIQKCKNWVNHEENPNGMKLAFKIVSGCKFIVTNNWHKEPKS